MQSDLTPRNFYFNQKCYFVVWKEDNQPDQSEENCACKEDKLHLQDLQYEETREVDVYLV